MRARRKEVWLDPTLDSAGDSAAPAGSREWATRVRLLIQNTLTSHSDSVRWLEEWIAAMQEHSGWRMLYDSQGRPFQTYAEFCREKPPWGLGYEVQKIQEIIVERKIAEHGGDRKSAEYKANQGDRVTLKPRGNSRDYLRARLERDHPFILKAFERGEYKTIKAAARAAGIVKVATNYEEAMNAFLKLNNKEQRKFVTEVTNLIGK